MNRQDDHSLSFARVVQNFFTDYLVTQRNVSSNTIASYRDTFRLLLRHLSARLEKPPSSLSTSDLNTTNLLDFLSSLETTRHNSIRSRNLRLSAIRCFLRYAGYHDPGALSVIHRSLAIPTKRYEQPLLGFLTVEEMQAILDGPDRETWSGERDHVMFATCYNTGTRVSEVVSLTRGDVMLVQGGHLVVHGKGRKLRTVPIWRETAQLLKQWLSRSAGSPESPLFPNRKGQPLTRSGVESRLREAIRKASTDCRSLRGRRISPHTLRHTTAMHLLQSGVDITMIALWLGHESPSTTHKYIEADLAMKEAALSKVAPPEYPSVRYKAGDQLLQFLESL